MKRSPMPKSNPKRCKFCRERMPADKAHHVIHDACISAFIQQQAAQRKLAKASRTRVAAKVQKAARTAGPTAAHPLAWHKKQAQRALNAWVVHVRDLLRPCISCGVASDGPHHAGHYRSRGAAGHLAIDARNLAKQCARCNLELNGNPAGFRAGLVLLHGEAYVAVLEADQACRKHTAADFDQLAAFYRAELRKFKETSS